MKTPDITISWPGGQHVLRDGEQARIGRERDNDIIIDVNSVSRHHAIVVMAEGHWLYRDLGSTQGSFTGDSQVREVAIESRREIRLGARGTGVVLVLTPATGSASMTLRADSDAQLMGSGSARPGGALTETASARPTVVPTAAEPARLTVTIGDSSRSVSPGDTLSIGRESDNDVVVGEESVSRRHARIDHGPRGWTLTDLGSSAGTWLDGTRVSSVALTGRQTLILGAPDTGARLIVEAPGEPSGDRRGPATRKRLTAWIAGGAAAAILIAGGLFWGATRQGVDLDRIARATVLVRSPLGWSGSGTVIDAERGLILTNAHVAAPNAMGTGVRQFEFPQDEGSRTATPEPFVIYVSAGKDKAAEPRFIAEPVAADGYLDLAVLKIVRTASGATVEPADLTSLTEIPIGNSDSVTSGDEVIIVGYPGAARSLAPTITEGVVSGFRGDERQNSNKAHINVDATVSYGNSGGLAVDSRGRLIGVPTEILPDFLDRDRVLGGLTPVASALPLITAAKNGRDYTSPWSTGLPSTAKITATALVGSGAKAGVVSLGCADRAADATALAIGISYVGFPAGEHTDVLVSLRDGEGRTVAYASAIFRTSLGTDGCATATLQDATGSDEELSGAYQLIVGAGGNYDVLWVTTLVLGAGAEEGGESDSSNAPDAPSLG